MHYVLCLYVARPLGPHGAKDIVDPQVITHVGSVPADVMLRFPHNAVPNRLICMKPKIDPTMDKNTPLFSELPPIPVHIHLFSHQCTTSYAFKWPGP